MMFVNHEVKGTLAKLLATENLIIEHKKVPTASFDVQRRVLTLPIWDRASGVVYDLLVGHEVGHALYTPNEDWRKIVDVPKDYVNIVEDARIEKLMKRKFPGLTRTFYNGYKELNQEDFFSIADEDLSELIFIDRINLHFKIGAYAQIPFNEDEQVFVEMIEHAETFREVLTICELIYKYVKENHSENMIDTISLEGSLDVEGGSGEESGQQFSDVEINPSSSSNSFQQENSEGGKNSSQENTANLGGAANLGGGFNPQQKSNEISKTQQAFDKQAEKLTDSRIEETHYIERPFLKIDNVIVDYKNLLKYITKNFAKDNPEGFVQVDKDYKKYYTESQKEVNYLVKEFEMKKSADAYQRMSTARTGTLDTTKLHTYKYNEDLFRKISVIPDGKNHGLVFVLDWSGSMNDYLLDTVKQLLNLVWFCKKIQIPFEVYAFTYEWCDTYFGPKYVPPSSLYERKDGTIEVHRRFRLLNFLSSRSNTKVLDQCILNLWRLAAREDSNYAGATYHNFSVPPGLTLSGTPLNESIIALHQIIPQFKSNNKLQKVNVVILTDGESNMTNYDALSNHPHHSYGYLGQHYIGNSNALRDRKIGHVYRNIDVNDNCSNLTAILLENLKDNFPEVNLIGFRICTGGSFSTLYRNFQYYNNSIPVEEVMKVWRKEKSYQINGIGYDALYVISSHDLSSEASMSEVDKDATIVDIGKAFRTMLKKKTLNKKMLSSFISMVA